MANTNSTVVYTAVSNNYDTLKDPRVISPNCDYVCFTDNKKLKSKIWRIREFPDNSLDLTRKYRKVKILPHLYFSEYKYSIWIDGNIEIIGDVEELIKCQLINKKITLTSLNHPDRDCLFDEAYVCIKLKKDYKKIILRQIERYKKENIPQNLGLVESRIVIRKHNNSKVIQVMKDWWSEVLNYSKRDQISFNYVTHKNNFNYSTMDTVFDEKFPDIW